MKRALGGVLVLAAILGAACGQVAKDKDKVLAAIDRTESVARSFTYTETTAASKTVVSGAINDDWRYRLDAKIDGQAAASEIVYDDTRALLAESPAGAALLAPASSGSSSGAAAAPSATLRTGVWLEDPQNANSLITAPPPQRPGSSPFVDALTALEYVRFAVSQASTVQVWNPESENFRPRLDVFPKPGAGVVRYDLIPPDLPARQRVGTGTNIGLPNQVPGVPFFRLMAIYIRDGLIVDVREVVSITPRLSDAQSNLQVRIGDFTNAATASSPLSVQTAALLFSINRKLALEGQPLIRPRSLDLSFSGLGRPPTLSLPEGATQTDLSGFGTYGLLLYESH